MMAGMASEPMPISSARASYDGPVGSSSCWMSLSMWVVMGGPGARKWGGRVYRSVGQITPGTPTATLRRENHPPAQRVLLPPSAIFDFIEGWHNLHDGQQSRLPRFGSDQFPGA